MRIENGILSWVRDSDIPSDGIFVIPDNVTEIGYSAFFNCKSLKSAIIPNSVIVIGDCAFSYCTSLESVVIPNSVIVIGKYAFYGCTSLKQVTIPEGVTEIGSHAFCNCISLISIEIPNSVTTIRYHTFWKCVSLKSISIPNSITKIEYYAFSDCSSLISVIIPSSVTEIGVCAFSDCESLTSIILPSSVSYNAYNSFYKCTSLTKVNDLSCKCIDDIPMIITSQKQVSEYTIYHGYDVSQINFKEKSHYYAAEKDGFTAHGKTIEEAIKDLIYKITQDKLAKDPIYLDTVMTINHYRAITGACSFGVAEWMKENKIKESDKLTVRELLPILERTKAYGFEKFKELIKDN